jgi:tripartite motif-containing protein 71
MSPRFRGVRFILRALLLLPLVALMPRVTGAQVPTLLGVWGSPGLGPGQFYHPTGVAVGESGRVYVTDQDADRVQAFTRDGDFLFQWGDIGILPGYFQATWCIASDAAGNLYVGDRQNERIQVFAPSGAFLNQWSVLGRGSAAFSYPLCVTVDDSSYVYVVESNAGAPRIERFGSDGTSVSTWGSHNSGNTSSSIWNGIAVGPDGLVYATDAMDHCINRFTREGVYVDAWPPAGGAGTTLGTPQAVGFDATGRVYVADLSTIRVFTLAGDPVTSWTVPNGSIGVSDPVALALDAAGNLYLADWSNRRVLKYGPVIASVSPGPLAAGSSLAAAAPNPSSSTTSLRFTLPREPGAELAIFDVRGRRIRSWRWEMPEPGPHELVWDGRTEAGTRVPPGIYFERLSVAGRGSGRRLVRIE